MVIDGVMEERVTAALLLVVPVPDGAAQHAMPAAVRDAALLFDVDVDEVARLSSFVANGFRSPDREAGGLIDVRQDRHPVSVQNPLDGGAGHAEVISDPVRTPSSREPQCDDPPLEAPRGARRTATRPRRALRLRGARASSPGLLRCCCRRHLEPLGRSPHRPALSVDQVGQPSPTNGRQGCVSVSHEDLRVWNVSVVTHILPGGLR